MHIVTALISHIRHHKMQITYLITHRKVLQKMDNVTAQISYI